MKIVISGYCNNEDCYIRVIAIMKVVITIMEVAITIIKDFVQGSLEPVLLNL